MPNSKKNVAGDSQTEDLDVKVFKATEGLCFFTVVVCNKCGCRHCNYIGLLFHLFDATQFSLLAHF